MEKSDFQIQLEAKSMLDRVWLHLDDKDLPREELIIDHICFRCATTSEFPYYSEYFSSCGDLTHPGVVDDRAADVYTLHEPFIFREMPIAVVELLAPKEGNTYPTGWEHMEFVWPGQLVGDSGLEHVLREAKDRHGGTGFTIDTKNIECERNPSITIAFPSLWFRVRYHREPLCDILEREKSL